ncbi:MAG: type transport system ATP-binding protein [Actinomycetota bacterium]|nr:type transport system ATP-binding protein [Actinomycetota bacterium]
MRGASGFIRRWAAFLGALAMVWAMAVPPAVAASGGYRTEDHVIDVVDGPAGDQHVAIDSTLYLPSGVDAGHPAPAIIGAHGFGQDKHALAADAAFLARRGYAVLLYSARGFGNSTGKIGLDSPDYEVKDVHQLVDWLGARPEVRRDAGGPLVGMFGESYGGGMALMAAAYDPRIRAIVPIVTWNSLVRSFLPNDISPSAPQPGVFKQGWASVFLGGLPSLSAASTPAASLGNGAAMPPSPCPAFVDAVCNAYVATAEAGQAPPEALALMAASSPASVMSRIKAPTLLVQGESDTLFDLSEAAASQAAIAANGVPVKTVWIPGGHSALPGLNAGSTAQRIQSLAGAWFDRWLKADASVNTGPAFEWYDAATKRYFAGATPAGGTSRTLFLSSDRRLTDQARSARPGIVPFLNPAGGQPAALSQDPTGGFFSGLPPLDIPGQNASFETAPLPGAVEVVGSPYLRLRVVSSTSELVAFVKVEDVATDATVTLPGGLVGAIRLTGLTPGVPKDVEVTMPALAHLFKAGDRIRLILAATDSAYANQRTAAVYGITVDPAASLGLTLPTAAVPAGGGHVTAYAIVAAVVLAAAAVLVLTRRRSAVAPGAAVESAGATAAVTISGLTKRFRGGFLAVDNLSLSIGRGQVFGLLGPNGAGKTTTIRMLLGLVYPTAGGTAIFGETMRPGHPVLSRVGTLVEGPRFVPHLSGIDNLRLFWRAGGRPLSEAHMEEALAVAELGDAVNRPVRTYSHGMRQRLGIAQALLGQPELLILDEPTNGLDPQQMYEMRQLIRTLAGRGITVLLSSHLLGEVEQVCTHAAIMDRGRLVASGTVADLVGASPTVYVEVDDTEEGARVLRSLAGPGGVKSEGTGLVVDLDGSGPAAVAAALVAAGVGLQAMTPRRHLEDVFLGLIEDEREASGRPAGNADGGKVA